LNLDEVEPGVTKLAPVRLAPKDAQKPIEYAMRRADSVRATIWAHRRHNLTLAGLRENSEPGKSVKPAFDFQLMRGKTFTAKSSHPARLSEMI
jgi:hypothetical protein